MDDFTLNFIGVGAAKAGTTWLAECMREHPQICMSTPKELNYFCRSHIWLTSPTYYDEGDDWLRARFSHWGLGQIRGEYSVSYLVDPASPMIIREHFPDTKIIISYRNPTDTLYSLYYQAAKEYAVPDTFEDFLDEYPQFIQNGMYYTHTRRYLEAFPSEKFHFILFDDICSNPGGVLVELFKFLGVDATYLPPSLSRRVNPRKAPKSVLTRDLIGNTTDFLRSNPRARRVKQILKALGADRLANWIQAKNLQVTTFPPMREDTRTWLVATYADENRLLGNLLDRDLSHWNK